MGLLPFMGVPRRIRRWAFLLLVVAAVYAGPRFANDMWNAYGPGSPGTGTTTTTTTTTTP